MKIDIDRTPTSQEIEEMANYVDKTYHWDFTSYTGQVRDLRKLIMKSVPKSRLEEVAEMTDTEMHDIILNNCLIPVNTLSDRECIYLIPLEEIKKFAKLER